LTTFPYFSRILCRSLFVREKAKFERYTVLLLGAIPPLMIKVME